MPTAQWKLAGPREAILCRQQRSRRRLRDIAKYTFNSWGVAQRRAYIADLEKSAEALAKGKGIFKDVSFILPHLRMVACGKHYIFCMPQEGKPSVILAVLHQSMDLMERLKDRLR